MNDLKQEHNLESNQPQKPDGGLQTKNLKEKGFWRELIEFAIIALVIIVPFRIYIAQPYVVNGASMDPTFKTGDYLIVDEISYRFHPPVRGSVIVFKYPKNTALYFIKRLIGFPGETVTIKEGIITITKKDGSMVTLHEPYVKLPKIENFTSGILPEGQYFVMGDNRMGSADSRMWGSVPTDDIVGRPIIELFPLSKFGIIPGDQTAELSNAN